LDKLVRIKKFDMIYDRFFLLVNSLKSEGHLPEDELSMILVEIWDSYEEQFLRFHQLIMGLKLGLILLFVLPGFLFAIFLSMNELIL